MNTRTLPVLVVAALLSTGFVALTADEGLVEPATRATEASVTRPSAERSRPDSVVPPHPRETPEPGRGHTSASGPPPESSPVRIASGDASPRLIVSAPPFIEQGATHDVVIAVRMPSGARSVEFTLSADPELIQLRDASPAAGSPRGKTAFEASVEETANRIAIKVEREEGWLQGETVELAVVHIDGVAPGSATIEVSEIGAHDAAGGAIEIAPLSQTPRLLVMSGPI